MLARMLAPFCIAISVNNLTSAHTSRTALLSNCRRIVVKVGTNTLLQKGTLHIPTVRMLTTQISGMQKEKWQVVLVTSGAVGIGAAALNINFPIQDIRIRQAAAAVGQPLLMHLYQKLFRKHQQVVAQVLMAREHFSNRRRYLNLRNTLEALLAAGVVPICNENDSVATDELDETFGDNDYLSALIASKLDADLLILLTDTDALYSTDPHTDRNSQPLRVVEKIDAALLAQTSAARHPLSSGGMRAKLEAIQVATRGGCHALIAQGRTPRILERLLRGEECGTFFPAKRRLSQRKRWMLAGIPQGKIIIDTGALNALRKGKSLLASGIMAVEGDFAASALLEVALEKQLHPCARLTTNLSGDQLRAIRGKRSAEAAHILPHVSTLVARPESIVFVEEGIPAPAMKR